MEGLGGGEGVSGILKKTRQISIESQSKKAVVVVVDLVLVAIFVVAVVIVGSET